MTKIWTQPKRELKRVPDMSQGVRGEVVIKEETAVLDGVPVVLFSAPGKVGVCVDAADLLSGAVTHQDAYQAVLNENAVSSPNLTLQ